MESIYNVCLLPPAEYGEELTRYSMHFAECEQSRFILGSRSIPHVTVAQFSTSADQNEVGRLGEELWSSAPVHLTAAGLVLLPSDGRDVWCEIAILKSSELNETQSRVLSVFASMVERVLSGTGDMYRPHFTVALLNAAPARTYRLPSLSFALMRASGIPCRLALGRSGEHYQVTELLRTSANA